MESILEQEAIRIFHQNSKLCKAQLKTQRKHAPSPPPLPSWSMVQDAPLWVGCGVPLSPVVWLWGLSFPAWGLWFKVKSYKASSRQELREGLGCRLVRVTVL